MARIIKKIIISITISTLFLLSACSAVTSNIPQAAAINTTGNALAISELVSAPTSNSNIVPISANLPEALSLEANHTIASLPGEIVQPEAAPKSSFISLADFTSAVSSSSSAIKGLYVNNLMALRVVQQPDGDDGYVSAIAGVATQFRSASQNGNIGMLAHNFAAGSYFSQLKTGDQINVIYGDGTIKKFTISEIRQYQALQPNNGNSTFVDLSSNTKLSASALFNQVYGGSDHLTLQTCIAKDGVDSWGRLFIIGYPSN